MKEIVLATGNKSKVKEFNRIIKTLPDNDIQFVLPEMDISFIKETGKDFHENAYIKASSAGRKINRLTIADDSGLCVRAIDGEPGILSARYGGIKDDKERSLYLLRKLQKSQDRYAEFICVLALYNPQEDKAIYFEGKCPGKLIYEMRGESGFGYDPIFVPDGETKTFAEMDGQEKDKYSHRSKALQNFLKGQYYESKD